MERWRSAAARNLAKQVRKAGGTIERVGVGKIRITGPSGQIVLKEPGSDTRADLQRSSSGRKIEESTGLNLSGR